METRHDSGRAKKNDDGQEGDFLPDYLDQRLEIDARRQDDEEGGEQQDAQFFFEGGDMADIGLFLVGQDDAHHSHGHQTRFGAQFIGEGESGNDCHEGHGRFQERGNPITL